MPGPESEENGWPSQFEMIVQLRDELGLFSGAMSKSPKEAWEEALVEVGRLRVWKALKQRRESGVE